MAKVLISEEILQETAEAIKNKANIVVVGGLRPVHFAATINRIGATTGLPALPDNSETVYEDMHMIFEHVHIIESSKVVQPRKITIRGGNHATVQGAIGAGSIAQKLLIIHVDKGVTGIQANLVYNANRLNYVRIGEDVTFIKANAFRMCSYIETIVFDSAIPPEVAANAFIASGGGPLENVGSIIVPEGSLEAYEIALAESGLDVGLLTELPPEDWGEDGAIYWLEYDIIQNDIANS